MATESTHVNVKVTGILRHYINQQLVPNGEYESASEYIRDLVRHDKEKRQKREMLEVEAMLFQSLDSPTSPIDDSYISQKKKKIKALAVEKRSSE